ncbi:Bis-ABC ATPase YheS [hydrothermal vent metagenome]|uniref:Bis-ABC ATPase YheS n=1 Tax=hydrothermal vent metagenome TaxID=652676 RepID=A0A3B0TWH2_9ZZZZ
MLHINDIRYRIDGRLILDGATAMVPGGHKVGLVGRNGTGKTTLLKLIAGELEFESGGLGLPKATRIGMVRQEAPGDDRRLIDFVLEADTERAALMAEAETVTDPDRTAEVHIRLADIRAHEAPSRAAIILAGLGFDEAEQERSLGEFSGGWRMRVALAALLFSQPDLLLLDEPTNYLDLEGALWLESYLRRYPRTVIIVSHDRDLLNRAVQSILHLSGGKLTLYAGGYDDFERKRREQQALTLKLKTKQDDARRHMEAFVERFRYKASKARQAQSRLKALEKMQPIPDIVENRIKPFHFPSPEKPLAPPLFRFEDMDVGYGEDAVILRGITTRIDTDDRIGLLGANGNGKSTFAKLLAGRLSPMSGRKSYDKRMRIGYFAQHQLDELNPEDTPYDHIRALMPEATQAQVRARLGAIGFGIETADTIAEKLSGGEKARLLFALATFHHPHLLILDEPTNHLDVESRESLVMALNDYEGAVILISHDRHLIEAAVDRLWLVGGGTVAPYDGDMDDYRALLLETRRTKAPANGNRGSKKAGISDARPQPVPVFSKEDATARRREAARRRAKIQPLKRTAETLEKTIHKLEAEIARLDADLAEPGLFEGDPARGNDIAKQKAGRQKALQRAETEWIEAAGLYEEARAKIEAEL